MYRKFGRRKLARYLSGSRSFNWVTMSCRTCCVALAVNAAIGQFGKCLRKELSCRYSGRNSCPHSEMQCASSIAKNETGARCKNAIASGRANRSGERYSNRYFAFSTPRSISRCSAPVSELFSSAAGIPICASCATWSCISAINGETTTTVLSSSNAAGSW